MKVVSRLVPPVALACWVSTLGACMFFRSLDELSEGSATTRGELDGAAPGDARGGEVGATPDGSSVSDAPSFEASRDGGQPSATSPCDAGAHALCFDFDQGPVDAGWTELIVDPAGALALDPSRAASPPRSLRAELPRRSGNNVHAIASGTVSGSFQRAVLEFDAYVESTTWLGGDVGTALAVLSFNSETTRTGTVFFMNNGPSYLSIEDSVSPTYFDAQAVPFDRWFHVRFDFSVSGTFSYSIDGVTGTKAFPAVTLGASPHLGLTIGLSGFNAPSPATRAQFDNVVLDLQ